MKIIASIPAYREALFLNYAIKSIYDFVDEIILVNTAMQSSIDAGYGFTSEDGTEEILKAWENDYKIHITTSKSKPRTFKELMSPGLKLAKELKGDWLFTVGADEIWPRNSLLPLKNYLSNCDKNGILGLNVWMYIFAPDFWHFKDFRNPRLAKITEDSELSWGDSMCWPQRNVYQFAGNTTEPYPPNTSQSVISVNSDYPKYLRAFHYSCVGEDRVRFKYNFYQKFDGTTGDKYTEAYIKQNWKEFEKMGYKEFTGKHPKIMMTHFLYNERKC
ncbi:MAG: hypothetical protein AABY22_12975 [Nanoarchaeota archaeon]